MCYVVVVVVAECFQVLLHRRSEWSLCGAAAERDRRRRRDCGDVHVHERAVSSRSAHAAPRQQQLTCDPVNTCPALRRAAPRTTATFLVQARARLCWYLLAHAAT